MSPTNNGIARFILLTSSWSGGHHRSLDPPAHPSRPQRHYTNSPNYVPGDLSSDPTRNRRDLSPSPLLQLRSCHELIASRCWVVLLAEDFCGISKWIEVKLFRSLS
ncbi:hypothetical protein NL676_038515 [Syzygium grande]|nr:hypothetical protein NL676_038515 [Syzygium grande]